MASLATFKGLAPAAFFKSLKSGLVAIINFAGVSDGSSVIICEPMHEKVITFFCKALAQEMDTASNKAEKNGIVKLGRNDQLIISLLSKHSLDHYRLTFRWMGMSASAGTNIKISTVKEGLTYMDYHRVGEVAIYLDMEVLRKQSRDAMKAIAATQVPLDQVKLVYNATDIDFLSMPRRLIRESIGKARLQHRLKSAADYEAYGEENPAFRKDVEGWIAHLSNGSRQRIEREAAPASAVPKPASTKPTTGTPPSTTTASKSWADEMDEVEAEAEKVKDGKAEDDDGFTLVSSKKKGKKQAE